MALAEQDAAAAATTVAARLGAFPVNEAQIQPIVGGVSFRRAFLSTDGRFRFEFGYVMIVRRDSKFCGSCQIIIHHFSPRLRMARYLEKK